MRITVSIAILLVLSCVMVPGDANKEEQLIMAIRRYLDMGVKYYYSSVAQNLEVKRIQQKIEMILDSKKIDYEKIDVAASEEGKNKMREIAGDPKALPPQLANGDQYCGDFAAFEEAIENEELETFLKIK